MIYNDCKQFGIVQSYEYILNDNNELQINENVPIQPSNNRGELLAIIHAMLLIHSSTITNCILYSDSLICINTINTWYDNRKKKNTLDKFKNLDLLNIMMNLKYKIIDKKINVSYVHVRSHQKQPKDTDESFIIWKGNNEVDLLANSALSL
jgi:ribonuclease HI